MAINFNSALGISPQILAYREKRSEVLASNLANADTPNFKARDIDFKSVMSKANNMAVTSPGHIALKQSTLGGDLMYRNPTQVSLDGNTVESHIEQAKYSENSIQYQASLSFISQHFSELMSSIKGG